MDVLAFLGEAGLLSLRVLLLIAPLLVWQWTFALARPWRAKAGPAGLTLAASVVAGLSAFAAVLPSAALTWDGIVAPGGYWDLDLAGFLQRSADLAGDAVPALLDIFGSDDERRNFQVCIGLSVALWLIRLIAVLMTRPPRVEEAAFLAAEMTSFFIGSFAALYAFALLLWSVNRLNFWLFLVLILLIQDFRYREPPLVCRLTRWLGGLPRRNYHVPP
jgi:hypothetical protein